MPKLCQLLLPTLVVLLAFSWTLNTANAARILGLFAHPSESHFAVMRSIFMELAKRKHNVTVYSSHRLGEPIENLEEIIIEPEFPFWRELQKTAGVKGGLLELSTLSTTTLQQSLSTVGAAAVDHFLSNTATQSLLKLPSEAFDYDLIIVDLFYTEALLALGHIHATPTIGIVSTNFENYMQHTLESIVPIACSPIDFQAYAKEAGFWQRLANIRACMARRKLFTKNNMAAQEKLMRKHFAHHKATASLSIPQLQSELALLLLNNYPPVATPRPLLPNIIPAGGLHIRPPRELPWHVRRFLDEARSGAIYMNLGNEQLCADLPSDKLKVLFTVLRKYKEQVLWACHDVEKIEGMPKNMMLQHAVSQTDILAHPHVKLFIMNGDLISLQDGIMRHVPLLGIPIFRNELDNMELAVRLGVGVKVDYANFTEASLTWALQALLYESAYQIDIRHVATAYRDRPMGALETCMFWISYVLRHNGGAELKTLGVGLPSNQLHLFDLFIFYFGMALLIVSIMLGVCYGAFFVWKRQQVPKVTAKLK